MQHPPEVVVVSPLAVRIATAFFFNDAATTEIYTWLRDGRLKFVRMGNDRRIVVAELERFLREDRGGVTKKKTKQR